MSHLVRTGPRGGRRPPPVFVYAVFALSGAAGLTFEVSWSRQVGLVLGNTAPAVALVLSAYFVGLAAGQVAGARLAPRVCPLAGYGVCELLTAAWGLALPSLLAGLNSAETMAPTEQSSWAGLPVGRAVWCFALLLPATIPLGATFPLLAEHLAPRGGDACRRVPLAYAANTVGGVAGVLGATSFVLVVVGVRASSYLAAAVCGLCGVVALSLAAAGRRGGGAGVATVVPPAADTERPARWWLALAAGSGFATLGLEVLYTRMFALVLHNSTYSFGAVLATFLAGLGLAAIFVAAVGRRIRPASLALAAAGGGAVAAPASVLLFVGLTGLEYFSAGDTFGGYLAGVFGVAAAVVLPPVTLLGMVLPAAFTAFGRGGGRAAGRLAAVNTLAAAAGAVAAGFLWLPWLGLWGAFGLLAVLLAVPPVIVLLGHGRVPSACGLGAVVTAAVVAASASPRGSSEGESGGEAVVRRWESAYGWVDVVRSRKDGSLKVRENLHYRHGSTGANATREYRQGRLPLLLHPRPAEVAFLGLGTGLTAAPVVADRGVEHAVVVELIPEVVEAARLLAAANGGVVDHPKVEVRVGDARHFLRATDRQFDLIVSDLFVPWESRAGYLYTVEHYAAARRRLRPGGLFCQWVALYQVGPAEFELIADSFAAAFPTTSVWWGQFDARFPIVALVGSDGPLALDPACLDARWEALGEPPGGPDPDLGSPAAVADFYLGDWPARAGRPLNTDEHPRLEFSAPVSQRSGRTLAGPRLRAYFDGVLSGLPSGGVLFGGALAGAADPGRRRAAQALSLFGPAGGD